jgi:hypothetical protein
VARESEPDRAAELVDYWTPMLLRLCVTEGIIEAFGREVRSPGDVAAMTGTHNDTLARVVRTLASRGVFEERGGGRFRLTDIGRRFLSDEPGSLAGFAGFKSWEFHAWAEATHTLKTGQPSFPAYFGQGVWDWLTANPPMAEKFNLDMRRRSIWLLAAALPLFDWPDRGTVVDVGGGNGLLLERLLELKPGLRGVVFDLAHVATEAEELLRAAGMADRVEVVGGDFFGEIPPGHDVYVLSSVLHDWDDDEAVRILEGCRRAMLPTSRLVVFESVLRPGSEPDLGKLLDLHMLVLFGARERTREEWHALLDRAGFELQRIVPTPTFSWIASRPRR